MKNKSFWALLLCLSIVLTYFACQKDDTIPTEQSAEQKTPKIETISYDDANTVFSTLKAQYNLDNHKASQFSENIQGRTTTDTLGLILETDIIKQVTLGDYSSYTMKIVHQNDSTVFYNLTIEYKNGASDMFITKYTPTDYWLNNKDEVFEGEVQSRGATLEQYTDPEEAFEEEYILGGGLGNPEVGSGSGGGPGTYSSDYPTDCFGTVIVSTGYEAYKCGCGDWPWDNCTGCNNSSPKWPGYNQVIVYGCEENWDSEPYDPGDTGNPGGASIPDPIPDDPKIAATIKPEECTERITGDLDGDCDIDAIDCELGGNSAEVCDCVDDGSLLNECTIIFDCIGLENNTTLMQLDRLDRTRIYEFIYTNGCSEEVEYLVNEIIQSELEGNLITMFPFVKYPEDLAETYNNTYPNFTDYLKNELIEIKNDQNVIEAITQLGTLTEDQVIEALSWGEGPEIRFTPLSSDNTILGRYNPAPVGTDDSAFGPNVIEINSYFADLFEQDLNSNPMQYDLKAFKFFIAIIILHELSHYADYHYAGEAYAQEGVETGDLFESEVFYDLIVDGQQFDLTINNFNEIIQQYFLIKD